MGDSRSWRSSVAILQNGQSWNSINRDIKPTPASANTVNAGIITFVAMLFFIISFTSPYWLQSFAYTYSDFKNMGLWEFCFDGFRYPKYQFDRKFTGCNYVYSFEYEIIREWLLPAWLMATQAFMTIAFLASMTTLVIVSLVLIRWPLQFIMRYEWHLTAIAFICEATTFVCVFFAVLVFGVMCWTRSWLLNPNFNYLSWSYGFAVIGGALHGFAGLRFLYETFEARDRKREASNTLKQESVENMNMHMHEQHHYI
ncbi:claudin superfamily protein pickel isoform X2 [Oratosquilla oratoria]|uniref:claudin superfamily protein pickel isoform X2 n=1 Tax=Oratosquilla oratoria TaxID=337810 RepID=UPI003F768147